MSSRTEPASSGGVRSPIRRNRATRERSNRKSRAFLDFHDDPSGIHADVRLGPEFERFRVQTRVERKSLLTGFRSLERAPV